MLTLTLHDKADAYQRTLFPSQSNIELLWNDISFADLTFAAAKMPDALVRGSRLHVRWDGETIMTARCSNRRGASGRGGRVTARFVDDFALLQNLGWPKPTAAIDAQDVKRRRYTGPTETVVKTAAGELSTRLGLGWTIPPTTGEGAAQRVEFRFHPLIDKLTPLVVGDKLTWSLIDGTMDVKPGQTFPRLLTPATGVIREYEWSDDDPTLTRAIVMGDGDGVAQVLRRYTRSGWEAADGLIREVALSARLADGESNLQPDADAAFAEGAAKVSVTATLRENQWFQFGKYRLGDQVNVKIRDVEAVEVIRRVVITHSRQTGPAPVVTPYIGTTEMSPYTRMGKQIRALSRAVRDQGSR